MEINQNKSEIFDFDRGVKIAKVFFKLGNLKNFNNKYEFIDYLLKKCSSEIEILGFKKKEELREFLENSIFGNYNGIIDSLTPQVIDRKEILKIISDVMKSCSLFITDKIIKIFIFPSYNKFTREKMNGVSGFCTNKCVIWINTFAINDWQSALKNTIAHELAHAISPYYNMEEMSIGEGFIFDGIAEHFREKLIGDGKSLFVRSISKEKSIKLFKELRDQLNIKNIKFYQEVFFGTGKYPLWAGYSVGYYLIEDYLKSKKTIDWTEIINTPPKKILDEIIKLYNDSVS